MATHFSVLAWRIPGMVEPGRLQSMGSRRVGHDWATLFSLFTFMHWRRKWQPTPVFLPGESQGQGSLLGASVYGVAQSRTWLKQLSSSSSFFSCTYFGEGNGNPLQYSCLENHMERGALQVTVHRVVKSQTQLSNWATTASTYLTFLYLLWRNNYC